MVPAGTQVPVRVEETIDSSKAVEGQLFAIVTPLPDGGFDAQVVNANGNRYVQLSGYRTVALPVALDAKALNTLQTFVSPETVAA